VILIDKQRFICVGSMHSFGYLGGLLGLIVGVFYIVKQKHELGKKSINDFIKQKHTYK
jgi:hypothetical protein